MLLATSRNRDYEGGTNYEGIKEPIHLSTMEERLSNDLYPLPDDFIKDLKLM